LRINWLGHIRVKDKYTLDERAMSEGEGVIVRRVLFIEYVFNTMFMYSVYWYYVYVCSLFKFMLVPCLCMQFVYV